METEKRRAGKYWICDNCAKERQWYVPDEGAALTVIKGLCGWCKCEDEDYLTPVVDYAGPGKKAIWD